MIVGTGLVAQPTFIFGESENGLASSKYSLGVVLALTAAVIAGLCPILQVNCKDMPISYFMLWSGIAKMIVALLCPAVGLPNNMDKFGEDLGVLAMISSASLLGLLFMQLAIAMSNNPLLVTVTRSMEIVMAVIVDMVTLDDINYHAI